MKADVLVLGAGIVGVSIAIHLAQRGKAVVLVDRRSPGTETSHGNAGLIQREGVVPYGFPQDIATILRHALNRSTDSHYHPITLTRIAPALARYWWHSRPRSHLRIQKLYEPLIRHSTSEHHALIGEAGAEELVSKSGWYKALRTERSRDSAFSEADRLVREFGVGHIKLSGAEFRNLEPGVRADFAGVLQWTDAWSVSDPGALVQSYATLFEKLGGTILKADARTLSPTAGKWQADTHNGTILAESAIVALGPWSQTVIEPLGYRLPLFVKRGYHIHYTPVGAGLKSPLMDADGGYMLSPMRAGIRLATGAEFALRDAPPTPVQLDRAERSAREFAPIGRRIEEKPWMGARPCTPDMMPVIGPATNHPGLWFAFGHAHHGFTLGPVTGRLVAEMMTGETPFIDPSPYSPRRFLA